MARLKALGRITTRLDGTAMATEDTERTWQDKVQGFLDDPRASLYRSYYPAGELADSNIVITVSRVDDAAFHRLIHGDADAQLAIV